MPFSLHLFQDAGLEPKILTLGVYDRIGGVGSRAQKGSGASVFGLFIYQTVCRKISKIVSDAKRKPSDRCTKKYCSSGSIPGTEKNTARSGSLLSRCLSDRCARNTASRYRLVNEKLTFAAYERKASAACYFGKYSLTAVCRKIVKIVSDAKRKPLDRCTLIPPAGASCRGSILIEFAVCMPVLIILLFYIHDLVRIKRYYSQTEFVAQQMANIIQNISQKRKDKKITKQDLKYAASLAFLSMYPGNTMYHTDKRTSLAHELSHQPEFFVYYVKGLPGGKASCIWRRYMYCSSGTTPTGWSRSSATVNNNPASVVRFRTEVEPSAIYPTLKINEGEVKIIIEVTPWCDASTMSTGDYSASDDQSTRAKKAFRCRLVTLKVRGSNNYFNSVVIFTPKPGLFSETLPQ